jgi:hypothetical protein
MYYGTSPEYIKRSYQKMMKRELKYIIAKACGFPTGENFKQKVPLAELITYKNVYDQNNQFQKYVTAIDYIISTVKLYIPCINLTGITLEWTAEQLINTVMEMYESIPEVGLINKTSC